MENCSEKVYWIKSCDYISSSAIDQYNTCIWPFCFVYNSFLNMLFTMFKNYYVIKFQT